MAREEALRAARYVGVGFINTTVHLVAFAALLAGRVPYVAADTLAYGAGVVVSYLINHRFTFRVLAHSRAAFARFMTLQVALAVANVGATAALVETTTLPPLAGQALVLIPLAAVGFLLARNWVFGDTVDTRVSPALPGSR